MSGSEIIGVIVLIIGVFFVAQSGALTHICCGYFDGFAFLFMLALTSTACLIVYYNIIWLPLLGLFLFLALYGALVYGNENRMLSDMARTESYKITPEYRFYFNENIGYDEKLRRMFFGPGRWMRILKLQLWIFIIGVQVTGFFLILKYHGSPTPE